MLIKNKITQPRVVNWLPHAISSEEIKIDTKKTKKFEDIPGDR
jgi:hypothetical protein